MHDTSLTPEYLRAPIFTGTTIAYTAMCLLSLVIFWFNPPPMYLWLTTGLALPLSVGLIFQTWPQRRAKTLTPKLHRLAWGYFLTINSLIVFAVALDHLNGLADKAWVLVWFVPINLILSAAMLGAGPAVIVGGLDFAVILLVAFFNNTIILPEAAEVLKSSLTLLVGYWGGTRILKILRGDRHLDVFFASQHETSRDDIETLGRDNEALEEVNGVLRQENGDLRAALEACQRQHHYVGVLVEAKIDKGKGIVRFDLLREGEPFPCQMTCTLFDHKQLENGLAIQLKRYALKCGNASNQGKVIYIFVEDVDVIA